MWKELLGKIVEEMNEYGEKINNGASTDLIDTLNCKANEILNIQLPTEYIHLLEFINGLEFNGFIIYGIDSEYLDKLPNQDIYGVIENNMIWYENEWQRKYIFLGESNISWYVYDMEMAKYYELDNPSGRNMAEFTSLDKMLEKMLSDALL